MTERTINKTQYNQGLSTRILPTKGLFYVREVEVGGRGTFIHGEHRSF